MTMHWRRPARIVGYLLGSAPRLGSALRQQLLDHPSTIDRLDASAASLWPANPEEAQPPRWQMDDLVPRQIRAVRRTPVSEWATSTTPRAPMCGADTAR